MTDSDIPIIQEFGKLNDWPLEVNMKKVIFLRHAKSQWDFVHGPVSDRDRPIKKKGIYRMQLLIQYYDDYFHHIDKVYCSPAKRALQTAKLLVKGFNWASEILEVKEELYNFSDEPVLEFISRLDDQLNTVVLVGHNPAFESCINQLGNTDFDHLPTASFGMISFKENSWKKIQNGSVVLCLPGEREG